MERDNERYSLRPKSRKSTRNTSEDDSEVEVTMEREEYMGEEEERTRVEIQEEEEVVRPSSTVEAMLLRMMEENRLQAEEGRRQAEETKRMVAEEGRRQAEETKRMMEAQAETGKKQAAGIMNKIGGLEEKMICLKEDIRKEVENQLRDQEDRVEERRSQMEGELKDIIWHTREKMLGYVRGHEKILEDLQEEVRLMEKPTQPLENTAWKQEIQMEIENLQKERRETLCIIEKARKDLENQQKNNGNSLPSTIIVQCQGNGIPELKIPTFNQKYTNPREFIQKLRKYMEKVQLRNPKPPSYEDVLETALEKEASRWWQTVQQEIDSFEEFVDVFLDKYWSRDIQKGMKRQLEMEKYWPGNNISRADYFIQRVILLTQMTPRPDEEEIVLTLSEQYDRQIQDARRVQDIRTIRRFGELLDRIDIEEANRKIRTSMERRQNVPEEPRKNFPMERRGPPAITGNRQEGRNYTNQPYNSQNQYRGGYQQNQPANYRRQESRGEEARYIPPQERKEAWNKRPREQENRGPPTDSRNRGQRTQEQQQVCRNIRIEHTQEPGNSRPERRKTRERSRENSPQRTHENKEEREVTKN